MTHFFTIFHLGHYGRYVWPAYGLVSGFLAVQLFLPWKRWRRLNKKKAAHVQTQ